MAIFSSNIFIDIVSIGAILVSIFVIWMKRKFIYWEKRGVITEPPTFFLGNMTKAFSQTGTFGDLIKNTYNLVRRHQFPHGGLYFMYMPCYVPVDPEIIKRILATDFQNFVNRGIYFNEEVDPLSGNLFFIESTKWKKLRAKLTPTFTSGKMKMMFETLLDCSGQLTMEMDKHAGVDSIEVKDILSRFTIDIIGSCAFGIECNSIKNPNNEFKKQGESFLVKSILENITQIFTFTNPAIMKALKTRVISKGLETFFLKVLNDTVNSREKHNIYRKDFMHLMLQLKNRGELNDDNNIQNVEKKKINEEEDFSFYDLAANAFIFFIAGFETSSTTMTFCLYELAINPDIQDKLRKEVKEIVEKHGGNLTYDGIMQMTYLDKVVNETLRKYPPLPALNRVCVRDYKVPGTDLLLEEGTKLMIPIIGLHHDERYYPYPHKFDPERFSHENKRNRPSYTFLPFGDGPRNCIGSRFGLMQVKVGICQLIQNYKFSVSPKTQQPLIMDPTNFILTSKGGMWLDYTKID